jgi:regulator of cell morphogenesis and NO signaling
MPDGDSSLPDWLIDVPASAAVFAQYGLDTSCGGKSLDYVCRQAGLDPEQVLAELRVVERQSNAPPTSDPAQTFGQS